MILSIAIYPRQNFLLYCPSKSIRFIYFLAHPLDSKPNF